MSQAPILMVLTVLVCLVVAVTGVKRLDLLQLKHHRLMWVAISAMLVAWAVGVLLDALRGILPETHHMLGLIGCALHLWATRRAWQTEAPPHTRRGAMFGGEKKG